jgi:glutathione S-transferase
LKIYGRRNATNVIPVLWTLDELGLGYTRFDVGGSFGGLDELAFRAMNPNGRIPVVDDDGFILFESNAIVRYLADAYGHGGILPASRHGRALADQWMDWYKTTFYTPFVGMFQALVKTEPRDRDVARIAALSGTIGEILQAPDGALKGASFIAGDAFTMGDIPLGAAIHRYLTLDIKRPRLDGIESWHRRLCERPAYRSCVMQPFGRTPAEYAALEQAGAEPSGGPVEHKR